MAQAKDGEGSGADVNLSSPAITTVQSPTTYQAKLTGTLFLDAANV